MANNFCRYLANQKRFVYGQLQPCCWFPKTANLSKPEEVKEYQEWLYSINDWVPECSFCYNREQKNMFSPRLESLERISDKYENGETVSVEFQLDRECNAACLICGPHNSTTWGKYDPTLKEFGIDFRYENDLEVEKYLEQIKENIDYSSVGKMLFLGGEPLRTNTHLKIINEIKKVKSLDRISLIYTTNGSVMPSPEIIDLWDQFKKVNIHLSIDGIGEHFNYLRWPLQWNQVENNLQKMLDLNNSKFKFTCSYIVTPFNIFYHDRYVDWAHQFFLNTSVNPDDFFRKPFAANGVMNLSAVPGTLQDEIRSKYQPTNISGGDSIVKLLEKFNFGNYRNFLDYISKQDQQRGVDWKLVFPEIVHHFT